MSLSPQELLQGWEEELAQPVPQTGAQDVTLQPKDFIVNVSFPRGSR